MLLSEITNEEVSAMVKLLATLKAFVAVVAPCNVTKALCPTRMRDESRSVVPVRVKLSDVPGTVAVNILFDTSTTELPLNTPPMVLTVAVNPFKSTRFPSMAK